MLGYCTIGTNDYERARGFYHPILSALGGAPVMDDGRMLLYAGGNGGMVGICTPYDEKEATVGNGMMAAFACESRDQVGELYQKALELGGVDEGEPGERGEGGAFYGAYCRDLDGNKLCFFKVG